MIAGYDYLTVRWKMRRFWTRARIAGAALLISGGLLASAGAAYYGYAASADANLDRLQVQTVEIAPAWPVRPQPQPPQTQTASDPIPELSLYSGDAGRIPAGPSLPPGFEPIEFSDAAPLPPAAPATAMRIPQLQLESAVVELSIVTKNDRRAYETPDRHIGHLPETANAGEPGSGWYFGHTGSNLFPGAGDVFSDLQQIPDLLRAGRTVEIITDNGNQQFLYRVTGTRVKHEDNLTLDQTEGHQIHLVSCVPQWRYDHRLIIDAQLIARKSAY